MDLVRRTDSRAQDRSGSLDPEDDSGAGSTRFDPGPAQGDSRAGLSIESSDAVGLLEGRAESTSVRPLPTERLTCFEKAAKRFFQVSQERREEGQAST